MKRTILLSLLLVTFSCNTGLAIDMDAIPYINPLDKTIKSPKEEVVKVPPFEVKHATLTKNSIKNQYTIAMEKFMQSNIRSSYQDFRLLIDNILPNDYIYMHLTKEMASIGFFSLSELAMSKISDPEITSLLEEDVKNFYFPNYTLTYKDQIYLAEIYSNILYNNQCQEATRELSKQLNLLSISDYANYLVAYGSMKNGDLQQAEKAINNAIEKNPQNINYKRLKAEILSMSNKPQEGLKYFNSLDSEKINTVIFDNEFHSSEEYISYKAENNDYWKKYHLAYYYYDKNELTRALRVLQSSISGKKNINNEVFALTAKVYYALKEYEKAQDYALKSLDIDKKNPTALMVLGDIAYRDKNYLLAESYYKKAVGKDKYYKADIKLAQTYQKLKKDKKAKDIYSKILKESSNSYEAYYEMALLEKDRESNYLKKSIAINPNFKDGWLELARLEIGKENYNKALSFLGIAKYIDENDFRYYYYLGLILKNKGLGAEAHKNFEKSLNLNPENDLVKEELSI